MSKPQKELPSVEHLKECFDYVPETGLLRWRVRPRHHFPTEHGMNLTNTRMQGTVVGHVQEDGYRRLKIGGAIFSAHRLIFKMHHGYCPAEVDHINRDRSDNRIENLRPATKSENGYNTGMNSRNGSGVKGVGWNKRKGKWRAMIRVGGDKRKFLGYFHSLDRAEQVVRKAREELHGEFVNHG